MKGIVGIVASRLIETYYRPDGGADDEQRIRDRIGPFGAGLRPLSGRRVVLGPAGELRRAHVRRRADDAAGKRRASSPGGSTPMSRRTSTRRCSLPQVDIDSELLFSDITPAFRKDLNRFQPFGPGNTAPVFATYGVSNHGDAKLVGVECEHLRMDLIAAAEAQHQDPVRSPSSSPRTTNGCVRDARSTYATRSSRTTTAAR